MIRQAKISDFEFLTDLTFKSKDYWGYPDAFFEVWSNELKITAEYIDKTDVFIYEKGDFIVGYYSIIELKDDIEVSDVTISKGFWLEHMFIDPKSIGEGIGTKLFHHLQRRCSAKNIARLGILSDPNAIGFYEKMGCMYVGEYPSTIKNRTTPHLVLKVQDC